MLSLKTLRSCKVFPQQDLADQNVHRSKTLRSPSMIQPADLKVNPDPATSSSHRTARLMPFLWLTLNPCKHAENIGLP